MNGLTSRLPPGAVAGIAALLCAGALGDAAIAENAPPFAALLQQGESAPRAAAVAADIARAEGLVEQARARPNPTVSVFAENIAGSAPYRGFEGAETTLQINQPFELGGKRSARVAAGAAGVQVARARAAEARLAYADSLALAYAAAEIGSSRIERAEDEVEEAEADLKVARALVGAGKEARLRSLQAEAALQALQADLELARANYTAALARLSALAGAPTTYTGVSGSVLALFDTATRVSGLDGMRASVYRTALAEREAASRRLAYERKRAIPDVTGSFGVRRLEREGATALVAGVSVPLPLFDRNRGNIAAARAEEQAAAARAEIARVEREAELRGAIAQAEAADARVKAAQASLGTSQEAYRLARIGYGAGKSSLMELLAARRSVGAARTGLLDVTLARFSAYAALARLQGRTILGEPIQ